MKKLRESIFQILGVALLFLVIFSTVKLLFHFKIADGLQTVIAANETWGWFLFILINALLFCLWMPAALLGSMAGAIFGLTWGSILFVFSCMLACLFAFYLTRVFLFNKIQQKVKATPKLESLQTAVENEGMLLLCLIRFLPIHATVLNLLLAVTRVNLRQYLFSSACMIPEWFAYIYLGAAAAETERLGLTSEPSMMQDFLKAATFILVIIAISYASKVAQKSLQNTKIKAGLNMVWFSPNQNSRP